MPRTIEIVTHCWSGPKVPIFHTLLEIQLESIFRYCPKDLKPKVTVFYNGEDNRTWNVINKFHQPALRSVSQALPRLLRRSIGRNIAALHTKADVVWFTDCDHVFMGGCLVAAWEQCMNSERPMVHPEIVNINKTHDLGDQWVNQSRNAFDMIPLINPDDFEPRKERKAIGGLQIVKGGWCRKNGYLNKTKWQEPCDPSKGWDFSDDVAFRHVAGGSSPVPIPGLYRIRHSRSGRDHGKRDHGRKTRK